MKCTGRYMFGLRFDLCDARLNDQSTQDFLGILRSAKCPILFKVCQTLGVL